FLLFFFFFFQAEDGIRDFQVTGVQTCALPISLLASIARLAERATAGVNSDPSADQRYMALEMLSSNAAKVEAALNLATENGFRRSEERRVGKECGCREEGER